jgi:hypothetical protein
VKNIHDGKNAHGMLFVVATFDYRQITDVTICLGCYRFKKRCAGSIAAVEQIITMPIIL